MLSVEMAAEASRGRGTGQEGHLVKRMGNLPQLWCNGFYVTPRADPFAILINFAPFFVLSTRRARVAVTVPVTYHATGLERGFLIDRWPEVEGHGPLLHGPWANGMRPGDGVLEEEESPMSRHHDDFGDSPRDRASISSFR